MESPSLQSQFDISGDSGIPTAFNTLQRILELVHPANDNTARQNVISSAQSVALAFQQSAANISQIAQSTDTQTTSLVDQVNTLAAQLGNYNVQIAASGQNDAGLDAAVYSTIESLSQIASVTTIKQPDGTFSVMLDGQTNLVSGKTVDNLAADVYAPTTAAVH